MHAIVGMRKLIKSHTKDESQKDATSTPLTNWRCFALHSRSSTRKITKLDARKAIAKSRLNANVNPV